MTPSDIRPNAFILRILPKSWQAYAKLMRLDRPVGYWLLFWPCAWGMLLATPSHATPNFYYLILFFLGSIIMRGAGCTYNDIIDHDIDKKVARTATRPVASGEIPLKSAWIFLSILCVLGCAILVQFNLVTILVGLSALILVGLYPFMKRWTWWPQAFLGLTFNWGALVGWLAIDPSLHLAPLFLYIGCFFWTLGYDTIYALQDQEDDALIGVKSTARLFGQSAPLFVCVFYILASLCWGFSGSLVNTAWPYSLGLGLMTLGLFWQVYRLNKKANFLQLFKLNAWLGSVLGAGLLLGLWL